MAKHGTSIRIDADLKSELERRAREAGLSPAALYERFISEGLRQDAHPLIAFRDGAGGRRATLAGTRLSVAQVIGTLFAEAKSTRAAAEYLDVPETYVHACVRYYAQFGREIDDWRERESEAAAREHEAWLREQAVLA